MRKNFTVYRSKITEDLIFCYKSSGQKVYALSQTGRKIQISWRTWYNDYSKQELLGAERDEAIAKHQITFELCGK